MAARHDDNLELHGRQWRVVVRVPRHLRALIGRSVLKKSLGTDSRSEAQLRRWAALKEFKAIIAEAERKAKSAPLDPIAADALEWRDHLDLLDRLAENPVSQPDAANFVETRTLIEGHLEGKAGEIERDHGFRKSREYLGIAKGKRTPLTTYVDQWLGDIEDNLAKRTAKHYRNTAHDLATYAAREGLPQTIEGFDRRAAGDLISKRFIVPKVPYKTARKYVSALSSYWRWLSAKGKLPEGSSNPWRDQVMPPKSSRRRAGNSSTKERAFTDKEITRLLYEGEPDAVLREFMLIAALSGMRIEEIAGIRIEDVDLKAKTVSIPVSKTEAGIRVVPIHPGILSLIKTRLKGKAPGDWLFPELPEYPPESLSERSMVVTKRFVTYRRGLGVEETAEGKRRSLVNFHSFRRWFVTKAEQAGIHPHVIAVVVGHKTGREGMTLGVYSDGPSLEQRRACVEAVKLPTKHRQK